MRRRPNTLLAPQLERLDAIQLLNAHPLTTPIAALKAGADAFALHTARASADLGAGGGMSRHPRGAAPNGGSGAVGETGPSTSVAPTLSPLPGMAYQVYRITDPSPTPVHLDPPFTQVRVQSATPVTGGTYNVFSVAVMNATARTFDASSGFFVRLTGQRGTFPVLTGDQQWKPGEFFVFYILTKKYFPQNPILSGGFALDLAGSRGVAIPGPSGIFLRVKYNPATFPSVLNWIVAHGPGAKGHELGLPDTAIWAFTNAKANIVPL